MSNKDYTQFSNPKKEVNLEVIQNGVTVALNEEVTVDEMDQIIDVIESGPQVEVVKVELVGVVVDCTKLNVRKTPNPYGEVIGTIDVNAEVTIDDESSTAEYYKICTAAGAEGFCMKKFIQIK